MTRFTPNVQGLQTAVQREVAKVAGEVLRDTLGNLYPGHGYDTGNLSRSYRMTGPHYSGAGAVSYLIGTGVTYAPFVEFGTYKMTARPHLGPALNKARAKYGGVIR